MTQEEIIKLAAEAGFKWPDICETTIEQRLERFANLVAVAEREKCTGTQEFVTLPREVVKRVMDALYYTATTKSKHPNQWKEEDAAMKELRAALDQPQNHVTDAGNMVPAGWKPVPVVPTDDMEAAAQPPTTEQSSAVEQPQVEQEPVASVVGTGRLGGHFDWCKPDSQDYLPPGALLYTHPQPKREPLTDEQILGFGPGQEDAEWTYEDQLYFARAIENAHNIK